jgi:hypothetical protein
VEQQELTVMTGLVMAVLLREVEANQSQSRSNNKYYLLDALSTRIFIQDKYTIKFLEDKKLPIVLLPRYTKFTASKRSPLLFMNNTTPLFKQIVYGINCYTGIRNYLSYTVSINNLSPTFYCYSRGI